MAYDKQELENIIKRMIENGDIVQNGKDLERTEKSSSFMAAMDKAIDDLKKEKDSEVLNAEEKRRQEFKDFNFMVNINDARTRIFQVDEDEADKLLSDMKAVISGQPVNNIDDAQEFYANYQLCPREFDFILNKTSVLRNVVFFDITEANLFAYRTILKGFAKAYTADLKFQFSDNGSVFQFSIDKRTENF